MHSDLVDPNQQSDQGQTCLSQTTVIYIPIKDNNHQLLETKVKEVFQQRLSKLHIFKIFLIKVCFVFPLRMFNSSMTKLSLR